MITIAQCLPCVKNWERFTCKASLNSRQQFYASVCSVLKKIRQTESSLTRSINKKIIGKVSRKRKQPTYRWRNEAGQRIPDDQAACRESGRCQSLCRNWDDSSLWGAEAVSAHTFTKGLIGITLRNYSIDWVGPLMPHRCRGRVPFPSGQKWHFQDGVGGRSREGCQSLTPARTDRLRRARKIGSFTKRELLDGSADIEFNKLIGG